MNKEIFKERYRKFDLSKEEIEKCILTILKMEEFLSKDIDQVEVNDIKSYMKYLVETKNNSYDNIIHFTRYLYYLNKKKEYLHMMSYFNTLGVYQSILNRVSTYESEDMKKQIEANIEIPPFGTETTELPDYTKRLMEYLNKHLPKNQCNKILAGNNHNISPDSQQKEIEFYKSSDSLKNYLKERHDRKVEELKYHFENNIVWFEQVITKEAIEYVQSNQEILSGVLQDDKLYVTKIPFDLDHFLKEEDEVLKRYYACHCSFVRESILKDEVVDKDWCYCSGGFAKFPFEQILGTELDIKLLKTPLAGDTVCRFEIDLSNVEYKKELIG